MMPAYGNTTRELTRRIIELGKADPSVIMRLVSPWELFKVPGFEYKDLRPSLSQASMALREAKAALVIKPEVGKRYNWRNQKERLVYLGMCEPRNGRWHQFALVDAPTEVWCEVHPGDLHMLEETKENAS